MQIKLDTVDFERYSRVLGKYNKNQGTMNMLRDQHNKIAEKNLIILGQLEMVSSIIIEKYGLDKNKSYDISKEGFLTEKT